MEFLFILFIGLIRDTFLILWVWDFLIILITVFFMIFFKKHRKAIFISYIIFNLTLTSYLLYELFWLLLAFILLLKLPYIMRRKDKKIIFNLFKIRDSKIFKGVLIILFLISLKNYIVYGTSVLNFIHRPIKLSIKKIKLEKEIGEFIWLVSYSENVDIYGRSGPEISFRTKEFFPVSGPWTFYKKSLEKQFLEYERERLDKLFPYEKFIRIDKVEHSNEGNYGNSPSYEEWIAMDKGNSKRGDISFGVRIVLKKDIIDESELEEFEEGIFKLFEYYEGKKVRVEEITLLIYPEENNTVFLEKKIFSEKTWEYFKLYDYYDKWIKENDYLNYIIGVKQDDFKEINNPNELNKYWKKWEVQ